MKRVIKGKLYNTDTAKECGQHSYSKRGDFHYFSETLYQKKSGEFFLHGEGGAASKYAKSCGQNEWCGDETIIPMTYAEAAQWAEHHLTGDEYEDVFGEVSEDDTLVRMNISMSAAEADIIKKAAAKAGMTVSAYIVMRCAE